MERISKELQGFVINLLILKQLNEEPSYAYKMIQNFGTISDNRIVCEEGYLYPLLKKLTSKGLLTTKWRVSDANQRRKYYNITVKGQIKLKKMTSEIDDLMKWRNI